MYRRGFNRSREKSRSPWVGDWNSAGTTRARGGKAGWVKGGDRRKEVLSRFPIGAYFNPASPPFILAKWHKLRLMRACAAYRRSTQQLSSSDTTILDLEPSSSLFPGLQEFPRLRSQGASSRWILRTSDPNPMVDRSIYKFLILGHYLSFSEHAEVPKVFLLKIWRMNSLK